MIAKVQHLVRVVHEPAVVGFISEDDLNSFERWLKYQAVDAATITPEQLKMWRGYFDEDRKLSLASPDLVPVTAAAWALTHPPISRPISSSARAQICG